MRKNQLTLLAFAVIFTIMPFCAYATENPADPVPGDQQIVDIVWSRTTEPSGAKALPIAGWSWSDVADINFSKTEGVWDGGAIGNGYIKDASRPWDIATWHTTRSAWNGMCDVRRFRGTFSIPEGYSVFDSITVSSVGDYRELGLGNIIAINDNMYMFVHPKDQELNDANYLQYFAFWTGTAGQELIRTVNNGELMTFHGLSGTTPHDYKTVTGNPFPKENPLSHTDGWYSEAVNDNVGVVMKKSPGATEFIIELIVEDFAEDGGMDRMMLTFSKLPGDENEKATEPPEESVVTPGETSSEDDQPTQPPVDEPENDLQDTPDSANPHEDEIKELIDEWVIPPNNALVPNEDGSYEVINEQGETVGLWSQNETDEWVYEELPNTGGVWITIVVAVIGAIAVAIGLLLLMKPKEQFRKKGDKR